jgi:hypothetical protein
MALKRLIHGEVSSTLTFSGVKFEYLEETLITTDCDITFILVPIHHIHRCLDADLFT